MQKIVWKYKEVILTKRIEGHLYHFPYCSIGAPYTLFYSNKCMCGEEAPESLIKLRDFMNQMNGNWNLVIKYRQADKQTDNGWWRRAMQLAGMSSERSSAHERVREGVDYDRARVADLGSESALDK